MSLLILKQRRFIKRFASLEFNRFLDYYKNAPDLNANADDFRTRDGERGERGTWCDQVANQNTPVCLST
jgi:hypothetical protein